MRRTLILCSLLAGCTVGPDYVKPRVDTADKFRFEDKEKKEAPPPAPQHADD